MCRRVSTPFISPPKRRNVRAVACLAEPQSQSIAHCAAVAVDSSLRRSRIRPNIQKQ